jgi:exopolysaccharide biosynthesis predicted pyruvyltransferase EpsI
LDICASESKIKDGIISYILDKEPKKIETIAKISSMLNVKNQFISNLDSYDYSRPIEKRKAVSIEQWLAGFANAEYVITDSFHGCVFSIIFNKPFWVIVNKSRGAARFESLLKLFGLENRIISGNEVNQDTVLTPIDWSYVNSKLNNLKEFSLTFLKNALNKKTIYTNEI